MPFKMNLLMLIVAFLFAITMALGDTADTIALATNLTPSTNINPPANATPSAANDIALVTVLIGDTDPIKIGCVVADHQRAYLDHYDEVANHLRNMAGNATLGTKEGGGWCWRYSCTYDLGIYACNDGPEEVHVPWATMAAYADAIKAQCKMERRTHGHWKDVAVGQAFDEGDWNVILGLRNGDRC